MLKIRPLDVLPEPELIEITRGMGYVWIIVGLVVVAAVAVLAVFLIRRNIQQKKAQGQETNQPE